MRALALALACAWTCACGHRERVAEGPPAARSFYYWRTTFALSAVEQRALAELRAGRLYVRMFDVVWDEARRTATEAGPLTVAAGARVPDGVEVVPVVFVRASIFTRDHLGEAGASAAAHDVWTSVQHRASELGVTPRELQIDCDWTDSSRAGYFAFLRALAAESHLPLSATIRLHQIKYRERTGVPPVARGTLMFYNMGRFSADPDARAIFDGAAATRYLARLHDYPLPLDVALPIWSWTMQLRDGAVIGLLQSTDPDELPALDFVARSGFDRYEVTRTTFLHGTLLREGDTLKIEVTGAAEAKAAAELVAPALPVTPSSGPPRTVTLFDLSERNLAHHDAPSLAALFDTIR